MKKKVVIAVIALAVLLTTAVAMHFINFANDNSL